MMSSRKYFGILVIGVAICFISVVLLRDKIFETSPLKNEMTLNELQSMQIQVEYIEDSKGWTDEWYNSFVNDQLSAAEESENILIVKPTGNIYFNKGLILQEAKVLDVLEGDCQYELVWLRNGLRSTLEYKDGKVVIRGMDRSFMQEDCKYLLFCDELSTNAYSKKKVYVEPDAMWFGCYNLTRDNIIAMKEDDNTYNPLIEFYTSSERTAEIYRETKKQLIEKYYGK